MSDLRAVAQQALEFVTSEQWGTVPYMRGDVYSDAQELEDALRVALAQAEPVQFNPAEALRLAEEFAQMKQAHGVFCNADSRRLMEEAHSALAAYLGIKEAK